MTKSNQQLAAECIADLEAKMAEMNAMVVDTVMGRNVTRGQLKAAFDRVANKKHWKNPINVVIDVDGEFDYELIDRAVIFFTGSVPSFEPIFGVLGSRGEATRGCRYRVRAAGYYAAVGA